MIGLSYSKNLSVDYSNEKSMTIVQNIAPFSLFEVPINPSSEHQTESSKRLSILGRQKTKTFHNSNFLQIIYFVSFIQ